MNNTEILVVKYGSSSVTAGNLVDFERIDRYADQLAEQTGHYGLIVVSSGAIAVGRGMWQAHCVETQAEGSISQQSLATIGSAAIFSAWQTALARRQLLAGQIQVTHREIDDPEEGGMLQTALFDNLGAGIVSIINENDALSDIEIAKLSYGGDNDGLASHIARKIAARKLCLLTDKDGVLDKEERLIREITDDNREEVLALTAETAAQRGTGRGGMGSKVTAALEAAASNIEAHIGNADNRLIEVLGGYSTYVAAANLSKA